MIPVLVLWLVVVYLPFAMRTWGQFLMLCGAYVLIGVGVRLGVALHQLCCRGSRCCAGGAKIPTCPLCRMASYSLIQTASGWAISPFRRPSTSALFGRCQRMPERSLQSVARSRIQVAKSDALCATRSQTVSTCRGRFMHNLTRFPTACCKPTHSDGRSVQASSTCLGAVVLTEADPNCGSSRRPSPGI